MRSPWECWRTFQMLWIDTLGDRLAVFSTLALIFTTLATVGLGMTILG